MTPRCTACATPLDPLALRCAGCGLLSSRGLWHGEALPHELRPTHALANDLTGHAWQAHDAQGQARVVKAIHPELLTNERARARFGRSLAELSTLQILDAQRMIAHGVLSDGVFWVAYDCPAGRPLKTLCGAPWAHESARLVVGPIARALGSLHASGRAHLGLSTQSVRVSGSAAVPVLTHLLEPGLLGALVSAHAGDDDQTVLGAPSTMAPERFTGAALDARTDLYALGVIAYELLEGVAPFEASTPWEWATCHLTRAPREWSRASTSRAQERTRDAVMRCMAKTPASRFASAEGFLTEFINDSELLRTANDSLDDLFGPPPDRGPYRA